MGMGLTARNQAFLRRQQAKERPGRPLRPLTAAATPIDLTNRVEARKMRVLRQGWQSDAASYAQTIPELSFAYRFLAHASSRMRYFPAMVNPDEPDGPPIPMTEVEGVPEGVIDTARQAMQALGVGRQALAPIQRALSYQFGIPGEGYLVGIDGANGSDDVWSIRSIDEFVIFDDQYKLREVPLDPQGILGWVDLDPARTYAARLWVPDFRFAKMATSPMRALLDVAEELTLLSRDVRASARSRLTGAGILKVPDGLRMGELTEDNNDPEAGDWFGEFAEAMMTPLSDEGVASSVVPIIISGDPDSLAQLDHLLIDRPYSALAMELRAEAIGRLATGLDVPREVLEGISDPNHWGGWLVSDDTFRHHIEPQVIQQVDALSAGYLRVWMTAAGLPKYWVDRSCVWYDPVDLISKPDPMANALPLWDRDVLSNAALLKAGGFSETDRPDALETEIRMLLKTRTPPPNVYEALMHALDPLLPIPPIGASGVLPGYNPKGVIEPTPPGPAGAPTPPDVGADTGPSPADTGPPSLSPPPGDTTGPMPGQTGQPSMGGPEATSTEPEPFAAHQVDGTMDRLSRKLTDVDTQLRTRIQIAASAAMMRALDKAGAKLHTRVQSRRFKDEGVRASLVDVPNRQAASVLGEPIVASLGFANAEALIGADWTELKAQFTGWVEAAQTQALKIAAQMAGLSANDRRLAAARQRMSESIAPAWAAFEKELNDRAAALLYNPSNPDDTVVVDPNTVVLMGMVRRALAIAGGADPDKVTKAITAAGGRPSLDYAGAADYLGTTVNQVRRLVSNRQLAHLRIGNRVMFETDDLDDFLSRAKVPVSFADGGDATDGPDSIDVSTPVDQVDSPDPGSISVQLDGQIGSGSAVSDMLDQSGMVPVSYEWDHGPSMRPFEPHEALDGVQFASFDDPVLANNGDFPDNQFYFPGDHDGCSCDFTTLWGPGDGTDASSDGSDDGSDADATDAGTTSPDGSDASDNSTPGFTLPDWMSGIPDYPYTTLDDGDDTFVLAQTNDAEGLPTVSLNNTTATIAPGSGWSTDDPYLLNTIRAVDKQAPGTAIDVAGTKLPAGAMAAVNMNDPDTVLVSKRTAWKGLADTFNRIATTLSTDPTATTFFMPAAADTVDDPAAYIVSHELGHALHARMGVAEGLGRATQVIVSQLKAQGIADVPTMVNSIASGVKKYASTTTKGWLQQLGVSEYGQTNLYEVIAESHAQYVLGQSTPFVDAMAEAMEW